MALANTRKVYKQQVQYYGSRKAAQQDRNVKSAVKAIKVIVVGLALAFVIATNAGCNPPDPTVNGVHCVGEVTRCAYEVYQGLPK